jgi:hypothetical protein
MSREDIENLERLVATSEAAKAEYEALSRAGKLMRQAAEILLKLPTERAGRSALLLADACDALAGPKTDEGNEDA